MANYSKDMERQNKALADLMSGKEYVKDYVQVGYEGKQEFFNSVGVKDVELEKEQWDMGKEKFEKMVQEAKQHIEKIEEGGCEICHASCKTCSKPAI